MLLVGGSPCQQLTTIGTGGGHIGLAGRDSVHFFVFPALARVIQLARPDLHVHVLVENAGSTLPRHRECMRRALGICGGERKDLMIDAGQWAAFPRKHIFLSTLPWQPIVTWPPRRSAPWDSGWSPRPGYVMPAMLRSRNRKWRAC